MRIEEAEKGSIGLIQAQEDGTIIQLALTEEQSRILNMFAISLSQDMPLVRLGEDYHLVPKFKLCSKCKTRKH